LNINSSDDESNDFDSDSSDLTSIDYNQFIAIGSQDKDNDIEQLSSSSYDSDLDENDIRRIGEAQLFKVKIAQDKIIDAVRSKR